MPMHSISVAAFSPRLAAQVQAVVDATGELGLQRHMRASHLPAVADGWLLVKLDVTNAERKRAAALLANWKAASADGKRAIEAAAAAVADALPKEGFHET